VIALDMKFERASLSEGIDVEGNNEMSDVGSQRRLRISKSRGRGFRSANRVRK